jgi:hypothetical protein
MSSINRDGALTRFEWSVRALAQPSEIQTRLFPSFVETADELALDFEEQLQCMADAGALARLSAAQRHSIAELDDFLRMMSGPDHAEYWTDAALQHSPQWKTVRELSRQVLHEMNWPVLPPPQGRAIFVGPL